MTGGVGQWRCEVCESWGGAVGGGGGAAGGAETRVAVGDEGIDVEGKIVRGEGDGVGIACANSRGGKGRGGRHGYGGEDGGKLPDISPGNIVTAMLNRVLR